MSNYFSLTKVLFKNSLSLFTDGKSKNKLMIFSWILIAICMIPSIVLLYAMFKELFIMMSSIHQEGMVLSIGMNAASILIFIFSIFLIPSIYYFSKDASTLLALPLSPKTIIASKFTVCIFYEYAFVLLFFIPLILAYVQVVQFSFPLLLWSIIAIITLPIYPLILSSLITILMMSFMPFMKRKDTFNIVGSILIIAIAFAFSFYINTFETTNTNEMMQIFLSGGNSLLNIFNYMFPALNFMAKTILNNDLISLLIYLIIQASAIIITLFIAEKLYFKGVIGVDETGSSKKSFSSKELSNKTKKQNVFMTYLMKEFKLLYRTPAYLTNCLLMCIIPAVCIEISIFANDLDKAISMIPLTWIMESELFLPILLLAGIIAGYAFANLTMISCTAISREGNNYVFMKYIPVSLKTQINAKTACGIITASITTILTLIPVYFLLPLPIYYYGLFFISALVSIIVGNYIGICLDIWHPKLIWEQEAIAVKQNFNAVIALLGGIAISIIIGFIAYQLPKEMLLYYAIGIIIISIILCFLFYHYAQKLVVKAFNNL